MILDSSAAIAILHQEPDARILFEAIRNADTTSMSVATFLETSIVVDARRDPISSTALDEFCKECGIKFFPVDETQVRVAREAYRNYGKGSGHKARLNFGDCFAYALAKVTGEKLLYKGADFGETDVASAL